MSVWKQGRWYWSDFTLNGERFRLPLNTQDEREAKAREKELIIQVSEGKSSPRTLGLGKVRLSDAIPLYLEARRGRVTESTIRTERDCLKPVATALGAKRLRDITVVDLEKYISARLAQKKANRTVNLEIAALRQILKKAKLWARLAEEIKPLPEHSQGGRALTPEEKAGLISTARLNPQWDNARLALALALNTTMRGCEIRGLRWGDVDLMDRELTIRCSKTQAGKRAIPLNADALAAILELRERAKVLFGDNPSPDWYVFPHAEGNSKPDPTRPMSGWRTAWRKLTETARLKGLRFHDLRHHAITELAESEASEQTIMALAGHLSREMLEHYSHIRRQAKRRAVEALESRKTADSATPQEGSHVINHVIKPI